MESLAFSIEGMSLGNPNTEICIRLETGLSVKWVKHIEQVCERIRNPYSIDWITEHT